MISKRNRYGYAVILINLLLFSCTNKVEEEVKFDEDRVGSDYYKHEVWGFSQGKWKQLFSLNLDLSNDSVFIDRSVKTDVAVRTVLTDDVHQVGLSVEYTSTNGSKSAPQLKSKLVKQNEIKEFCENEFSRNWQKYTSGNNVIIINKSLKDSTYSGTKKPFFMNAGSRSWLLDLFDNGSSSHYIHYFEMVTSGKRQSIMVKR